MPERAAFVARLHSAFSDEAIDDAIRRGKAGEPTFYACENGHSIGTESPANGNAWPVTCDTRIRQYCGGCDGGCVGQEMDCKDWLKRTAGKENS